MNKLSRFLIKMIFIILICLLLLLLFKLTGLRVTLLMFFFVFLGKTWNYGTFKSDINSQFEDYYSLFNLKESFSKDELQKAYENEMDKLNNNQSITIDNRIHLMGVLNTAFETLINPQTKSEYDDKYNLVLEEINASTLKSSELNNNISNYVDGLIKQNLSPFVNFKLNSKETLGLLVCIILDLVFILPFLK